MSLEALLREFDKKYGEVIVPFDGEGAMVSRFPIGAPTLDALLGGGNPIGRVCMIYGPESSGKTTVMQHIVAAAQRQLNKPALYIDCEYSMDPMYMQATGVKLSRDWLTFVQPTDGNQALDIAQAGAESGFYGVITIDSAAMILPKQEVDIDAGDSAVGAQARLITQALRRITGVCKRTETTLWFTNQQRKKIGRLMPGQSDIAIPGGEALRFNSSIILRTTRVKSVKDGVDAVGNRTKVIVVKNKTAPTMAKAGEFDIIFGEGISIAGDVLDNGVKAEIVTKRGAFFSYGDTRLGQGRSDAVEYLKQNPDMLNEIYGKLGGAILDGAGGKSEEDEEEAE